MQSDELKFDTMVVDTTLAEEYLKQHPEINEIPHISSYSNDQKLKEKSQTLEWYDTMTRLAELIEENKQLFCQLEYLIRKIPIKEVEECDLKLLINNILFFRSHDNNFQIDSLAMLEDTPLVNLGRIVQKCKGALPLIMSSTKTAAICYLFQQLCTQAGLLDVVIRILEDETDFKQEYYRKNLNNIKEIQNGCLGIITNRSDIDSAVDVFLETPTRKPWAICNILVEESAVEKFKKAISWKTRNQKYIENNLAKQCTAGYSYDGKLFLYEYVGERPTNKHTVLINSYKTVKDLLGIAENSISVSLWASDVAQSYEIAHNLKSNIVWINDFNNFNGPVQASQAFFSVINENEAITHVMMTEDIQRLLKVQSEWLKLDVAYRTELIKKVANNVVNVNSADFVHIDKKFMCVGKALPAGVVHIVTDLNDVMSVFDILVTGNGLLVNDDVAESIDVYKQLRKAGAPVEIVKEITVSKEGEVRLLHFPVYKIKAIWTSYGTIFAN